MNPASAPAPEPESLLQLSNADGSEMLRVRMDGRWRWTTISVIRAGFAALVSEAVTAALVPLVKRLDALERASAAQAETDRAQNIAQDAEATARRAVADAVQAIGGRVAAVEAKPEEAAHFTAYARLPTVTALGSITLTLTGLVPARAGDVLKAGETVTVAPAGPLPAGINVATATVPALGTVTLQLTATVALAASSAPTVWNITALR